MLEQICDALYQMYFGKEIDAKRHLTIDNALYNHMNLMKKLIMIKSYPRWHFNGIMGESDLCMFVTTL